MNVLNHIPRATLRLYRKLRADANDWFLSCACGYALKPIPISEQERRAQRDRYDRDQRGRS